MANYLEDPLAKYFLPGYFAPQQGEHRALPQSSGVFGSVADWIQNPARPERELAFGGAGNLARKWSQDTQGGYADLALAGLDMLPPGLDDLAVKGALGAATAVGPLWAGKRMAQGGVSSGGVLGRQKGIIGGKKALGADLGLLEVAEEAEKRGMSRDKIFDATGWWRGKDKEWRWEMDDSGAIPGAMNMVQGNRATVDQATGHPTLKQNYPDVAKIPMYARHIPGGTSGSFVPASGSPYININPIQSKKDMADTAYHETQHAIQQAEGFMGGGNPDIMKWIEVPKAERERARRASDELTRLNNEYLYPHLREMPESVKMRFLTMNPGAKNNFAAKLIKKVHGKDIADMYMRQARSANVDRTKRTGVSAYEGYKRLGGEVEARNVEARREMTGDERRFRRPWETQDIPLEQEIIKRDLMSDPSTVMASMKAPKKTETAYKLFRTDPNKPEQIFPLFVDANKPVPMEEWIPAEIGAQGKGGKVKSKIGDLAFRPGWHSGDMPVATHIGAKSKPGLKKPDVRPPHQVWAEVQVPADVDWQTIANERAQRSKAGVIIPRTAHITDQIPEGGFYRYKTNPNMTGEWLISGGLKVNRLLPEEELAELYRQFGVADLPRIEPPNYSGLLQPKKRRTRRKK